MSNAISDRIVLQFRDPELFRLRAGPKRVPENSYRTFLVVETLKGTI